MQLHITKKHNRFVCYVRFVRGGSNGFVLNASESVLEALTRLFEGAGGGLTIANIENALTNSNLTAPLVVPTTVAHLRKQIGHGTATRSLTVLRQDCQSWRTATSHTDWVSQVSLRVGPRTDVAARQFEARLEPEGKRLVGRHRVQVTGEARCEAPPSCENPAQDRRGGYG